MSLYIPAVQNWAVDKVASYASEKTHLNITVDRVKLVFPLDLGVEGVIITRQQDSLSTETDTIADVSSLTVDVRLIPLFRKQVEIDKLDFKKVKFNTLNLIASTHVKGAVGRLQLESHGIDIDNESLRINTAKIADSDIEVALKDTVTEDTAASENHWKIRVDKLSIDKTGLTLHMPNDTLNISAYMDGTEMESGMFDLYKGVYSLNKLELHHWNLNYDNRFEPYATGMDFNHLAISDCSIRVDSLSYSSDGLRLIIRKGGFKEKSGIHITELSGKMALDSVKIVVPTLRIRTPESSVFADVSMALNAFDDSSTGLMDVVIDGAIGKQDIIRFLSDMPKPFIQRWPNYPLTVKGVMNGNSKNTDITQLYINLPTAFNVKCNGNIKHITDNNKRSVNIDVNAKTHDLNFLTTLLGSPQITIPNGLAIVGHLNSKGEQYALNAEATQDGGHLLIDGDIDLSKMIYNGNLKADDIALNHIVPNNGLGRFSGSLTLSGTGTDFFSKRTKLSAKASITEFGINDCNISGVKFTADINNGKGKLSLNSNNALLDGVVDLSTIMSTSKVDALVSCNLSKIDLHKLHVFAKPVSASLRANLDVSSDLKNNHKLSGSVRNIFVRDSSRTYNPENIVMDVFTRKDSTHAVVSSGDFNFRLDAHGGYDLLMKKGTYLKDEIGKQLSERYIDQVKLREYLPDMELCISAGKENFFSRTLRRFGYHFGMAHVDLNSSPGNGINGNIDIDSLVAAGVQLDTIRLALNSDSIHTDFQGQVRNGKQNPQYVFNALFRGMFYERGLYFGTRVYDAKDRVGISLGLDAAMETNGLSFRLGSKGTPIIGYKAFKVNPDNYLFLGDDSRVSANLKLIADDGMGVNVYTNDSTEALQDLTVGLTKFELSKVLSVIPYTPDISGVMNGDFHVIRTAEETSISSAISVDNLVYESCPIGDISSEFVYMPKGDGSHFLDGTLSCDDYEIGYLSGTYNPEGAGNLDAELTLDKTPLNLLNGFIPEQMFSLRGYAGGKLSVKGSPAKPDVDGTLVFDSAYISSAAYGVDLKFAQTPITITKSHLIFDDFQLYASNKSPLALTGYYDFSNFDNMYLDLSVRATNYLLIDSKENPRSEAYGKAYVNFYAMLKGSLESLNVRGKLDVLGSTDMTYILRDSPLTTDNQMDELIKFVNFKDTTVTHSVTRPPLTGIDMDLSMSIDEGAHIVCALNADHTNYVDIIGGGNLRMQYNVVDNFRLTGRYTLTNGEMKYSLPVIPLKTFTIQDGSYIEFLGDPTNPKLNITATEHTKSTVSSDGGNGRSVEFDCGVVITKTLQDMGLQFIIDAPEDMAIHNELQTMSAENRGKIAVTMLTTGMYLAGGNTNTFSMNSALSAFLNSQINSISGSALRTLDLSFGMDNTTLGTGETQTDYSFKFAKRFWNNRLNIIVGGKLSTGADVENQNDTFFDNVTFEYRLSQFSNKYLKLFYERDSYDWLEGDVGKYGGGFMWRRKLQHFRDIFRFKSVKQELPRNNNDTITVKTHENNN